MQGPPNEIKWVVLRIDVIRFRFLARVKREPMGFDIIRIDQILLYNCRIERYQMGIIFLTRIEMIRSVVDGICYHLIISEHAPGFTFISNYLFKL